MALSSLLSKVNTNKEAKIEVDKNKIIDNLSYYQMLIDYWRRYPDKFVDYLTSLNPHNTFKLMFAQRLMLRILLRYKTVFAVFSRGFSKSFISVLALMIKCILYPGAKVTTVADGRV